MFSSNHAIWKFANAGGELDDWLPYAEELVQEWSTKSHDEVKLQGTFEIVLAAFLLIDDLLPASAKAAFANVMLATIDEASNKKLCLKSLSITPPKSGRKANRKATFMKCWEVRALIQEGKTSTEAYKVVAEKYFKSPDTIRREYERIVKKQTKRKKAGENDL